MGEPFKIEELMPRENNTKSYFPKLKDLGLFMGGNKEQMKA